MKMNGVLRLVLALTIILDGALPAQNGACMHLTEIHLISLHTDHDTPLYTFIQYVSLRS